MLGLAGAKAASKQLLEKLLQRFTSKCLISISLDFEREKSFLRLDVDDGFQIETLMPHALMVYMSCHGTFFSQIDMGGISDMRRQSCKTGKCISDGKHWIQRFQCLCKPETIFLCSKTLSLNFK